MDQPQAQPAAATGQHIPGVIDSLKRAWAAYRPLWLTYSGVAIVPLLISYVVTAFIGVSIVLGIVGVTTLALGNSSLSIGTLFVALLVAVVLFLVNVVIQAWGQAAMLFAATHTQGITFSGAFRGGWKMMGPVFWTSTLAGLITMAGLILFIIPGIIIGVYYSLALVVCVVEGKKGTDALRQSKALVSGHWFKVFWRQLALGLLASVVDWLVTRILGNSAGSLLNFILALVFIPVYTLFMYHLYLDLKKLKGAA